LHHLQGALPVLSSAANQDQQEDPKNKDPLREFLLDQQNISDVKSENSKNEIGHLAIGQIKDSAKKFLRKSVRNEVVGFDAIREEEETKDVASVAFKAAVAVKKTPAKEKEPTLQQSSSEIKEKQNEVRNVVSEPTKNVEKLQQQPQQFQTGSSLSVETNPEDVSVEAVSSMFDFVPASTATSEAESAEGNFTENELLPAQTFVPMVQIVEEQVTQWYPLHVVCSMLRNQGRVVDLENLLWGSTGIRREDRKMIFWWTLKSYVDHGMLDRAVMLGKRLEYEGLAFDFPEFHALMGSLIQNYTYISTMTAHNSPAMSMSLSPAISPYTSCPSTPISSGTEEQLAIQAHYHRKLKKAIAKENAVEGLAAFNELEKTGKQVNVTEMSSLVELLVKDDALQDATNVTEKMLQRDTYPMPKIFRFLLNRLASTGHVELMNTIGQYLTTIVKKEVSFDNRLCNAYLAAGRGGEYLDSLEKELNLVANNKDDEQVQILKEKFPRGGAMGLLESNPHLVDQYTRLANKFLEFGFVAPVNVLWTYHFINGRYDTAAPLWEAHVKTCPQIMFQKVCQTARTTGNSELAWRLVDLLHNATVTQGARGIAYSCLLDVLTQQGSYAEGCDALRSALNNGVSLSDINRTALKRLKEGVEEKGLLFPYDIPKKVDTMSECDSEMSVALMSN
jgi:hypothetical protein